MILALGCCRSVTVTAVVCETGPPLPASVLSGGKKGKGREDADRQRECDRCGGRGRRYWSAPSCLYLVREKEGEREGEADRQL